MPRPYVIENTYSKYFGEASLTHRKFAYTSNIVWEGQCNTLLWHTLTLYFDILCYTLVYIHRIWHNYLGEATKPQSYLIEDSLLIYFEKDEGLHPIYSLGKPMPRPIYFAETYGRKIWEAIFMYFLSMEWFAHLNELPQILQAEYIGDCEIQTIRLKTMSIRNTKSPNGYGWRIRITNAMDVGINNEWNM